MEHHRAGSNLSSSSQTGSPNEQKEQSMVLCAALTSAPLQGETGLDYLRDIARQPF